MQDESDSPYAAPAVQESEQKSVSSPNGAQMLMNLTFSTLGFAAAVVYIDEFSFSETLQTIRRICLGTRWWIGWGILTVSFVIMWIVAKYLRVDDRVQLFLAVSVGVAVTILTKYLLDGRIH